MAQHAAPPGKPGRTRQTYAKRAKRVLPLRIWLVVLVVAISAFGLLGSSVAVHYIMRDVLYSQADEELYNSATGWAQDPDLYQYGVVRPPSEYTVIVLLPSGEIWALNDSGTRPDFSQLVIGEPPTTVDSLPGSERDDKWRAAGMATEEGSIVVVGKSLAREQAVLRGLSAAQAFISVISLIVMAIAGMWFVRRALEPLREVETTARAITKGQTHRRVPQWSLDTEVGQLAVALNSMLERLQDSLDTSERALDEATSKEEQMRRFVGDASHELRTPLTSLRGYVELYRSGATDDVNRVLDKIDEESGRMKLLVEDLLALTRAEGSRLDKHPVDVLEIALAALSSAQAAFPDRVVDITNDTATVPLVDGDPDRLHQVLLNLITNGLRHGGEDAQVTIGLKDDPDSTAVIIDIEDDGKGMSEKDATHIFERFYRADSSRSRGTGGSGLGLSIVRTLVEQHDGSIKVASQEGVGTTFRVTLPRIEQPAEEATDATAERR